MGGKLPEFQKPTCDCKIASISLCPPAWDPQLLWSHRTFWNLYPEVPREARGLGGRIFALPPRWVAQRPGQAVLLSTQGSWLNPSFWTDTNLTARSAVDSTERCKLKAPSHLFMQLSSCPVDVSKQAQGQLMMIHSAGRLLRQAAWCERKHRLAVADLSLWLRTKSD